MGWKMGETFKREGTYVYLWLIHIVVWQKPIQYCKAIILQLKNFFNDTESPPPKKKRERKKYTQIFIAIGVSLVAQMVKNLPTMWETCI